MAARSLVLLGILADCCRRLFIRWLLFRTAGGFPPGFSKKEITDSAFNRQFQERLARNDCSRRLRQRMDLLSICERLPSFQNPMAFDNLDRVTQSKQLLSSEALPAT